jgi:hypothetical protein
VEDINQETCADSSPGPHRKLDREQDAFMGIGLQPEFDLKYDVHAGSRSNISLARPPYRDILRARYTAGRHSGVSCSL